MACNYNRGVELADDTMLFAKDIVEYKFGSPSVKCIQGTVKDGDGMSRI